MINHYIIEILLVLFYVGLKIEFLLIMCCFKSKYG